MKRNVLRRSLSLLLTLLVAFGMTVTVFAGEVKNGDVLFFVDGDVYQGFGEAYAGAYNEETGDDVVLTSVTSSNANVATVYKRDGYYFVKGVAVGKVTITGKYTYQGKEVSASVPLEVKKLPVLFSSLKVNGKKVSLSKHPFGMNKKTKATSVKIKAKLASGWKVKKVTARAYKGVKDYKGTKVKVTKKMIKKGKKIKFAKKYKNLIVFVDLVNTSTGERSGYSFQFYRKTPFAK